MANPSTELVSDHDYRVDLRDALGDALKIFLPLFVLISVMAVGYFLVRCDADLRLLKRDELAVVDLLQAEIENRLYLVGADLMFFAQSDEISEIFEQTELRDSDPLDVLARQFEDFSGTHRIYDQIRLLDRSGMECVRVNCLAGVPSIVPKEQLQYKGDRYYFKECVGFARGTVYVSPFDLNVERGVIEQPAKPIIRFGTPVFDAPGKTSGILLMNLLGQHLLDVFTEVEHGSKGELMLLNSEGYWCRSSDPDAEWGFMYPDRKDWTFAKANPDAWARLLAQEKGQFETEEGMYTFCTIFPSLADEQDTKTRFWKAVSFVPSATYKGERWFVASWILVFWTLAVTLAGAGSWRLGMARNLRGKHEAGLRQAYTQLKDEVERRTKLEQRFRRLIEFSPEPMIVVDADGKIVLVNAQAEQCFGYGRDELLGQSIEILVPEDMRGAHQRLRGDYSNSPRIRRMGQGPELVGQRKSGERFPTEISLGPIQTEEGLIVCAAIRDITERKRAELQRRETEIELLLAQRIQGHLLPQASPNVPGFDIAGASFPAAYAGGDHFDFLPLSSGSLGIVVGDVSGHGFASSLLMASTHSFIRAFAQTREGLEEILRSANGLLLESSDDDHFVTLFLGCLEPGARTFRYTSAGHPPGFLLDGAGRVKAQFDSTGMPMGVVGETVFPVSDYYSLQAGDLIVLLTDGVLEAASPKQGMFGTERALDVVRQHRRKPAREIVEMLSESVCRFAFPDKLSDDVTTVVVKVDEAPT